MWNRGGRGRNRGSNRGGGGWSRDRKGHGGGGNFGNRSFRGGGYRDHDDNSQNKEYKKRSFDHKVEKLNETDVGVTEFISDLAGFTGILKSRYSDFHVNEIDLDGTVAKLTSMEVPKDPEPGK